MPEGPLKEIRVSLERSIEPLVLQTNVAYRIVIERRAVEVYLHDLDRKTLPGAPFEVTCAQETLKGTAAADGKATFMLKSLTPRCTIRWSDASRDAPGSFDYELEIFLDLGAPDTVEGQRRRLHNLGLPGLHDHELALGLFQQGWDLEVTHQADDGTVSKLDEVSQMAISLEDPADDSGPDDGSGRT
jgi:hypothetical protein